MGERMKLILTVNKITNKNKLADIIWALLRTCLLTGLCFMILYPVLLLFTRSFMGIADMSDSSVILFPKSFSFGTILLAFEMMDYSKSLLTTVVVVSCITVLQCASCLLAGYGFARYNIPFKNILFGLVIFTIIVPPQIYISSIYLHFKSFDILGIFQAILGKPVNMVNSLTPLLLLSATANGIKNGLFIFIFRQNFRNMPKEIEEAATVDGAGNFATFLKIMVPNAIATIVTVALFSFIWTYNDSTISGILAGNAKLLSIQYLTISDVTNLILKDLGIADTLSYNPIYIIALKSAGVLLVIAPLVLLYLALQRFFVESVERSGLVG